MMKLTIGSLAAGTLVVLGLWLWRQGQRLEALCPLAAGEFVLMRVVADDLFPRSAAAVTRPLKWAAAAVFALAGLWVIGSMI